MFKIAKIEACAVAIPLKMPIKMAGILIETCDNLIVKVTDSEGNVGWGEASSAPTMTGETAEGLVAATKFMASRLDGAEVTNHEGLVDLIEPLMHANHSAKSAIDGALHDLIGKHSQKPMYELLGGKKRLNAPMFWMIAGSKDLWK
jgi:muconate cycloisomerase